MAIVGDDVTIEAEDRRFRADVDLSCHIRLRFPPLRTPSVGEPGSRVEEGPNGYGVSGRFSCGRTSLCWSQRMSESRGVRHQPPNLLADDDYIRQFGVEPKLKRGLHTLANAFFAIAFQSPTAGCLLLIGAGLALAGPAFWWVWPVILVFQFIVVLNWAEVISHYPLTGG